MERSVSSSSSSPVRGCIVDAACCKRPLQRDGVKVQQGFSTHLGPNSPSVTQHPTTWRNPRDTLTHIHIYTVSKCTRKRFLGLIHERLDGGLL